jgi:signal peptidase I
MIIVKIKGGSMAPILMPYKEYQFDEEYSHLKHDDIVLIDFLGNLTKFVKGIPGDKLSFSKVSYSFWNILINDTVVKTSKGIPYMISNNRKEFLEGYIENTDDKIAENCYFVLGNMVNGSQDSVRYGMFSNENIIAKLIGGNDG